MARQAALQRASNELGLRGVRQHGLLDDDIGVVVGYRTYNRCAVRGLARDFALVALLVALPS
jgi:hypothetical protein